MPRTSTGTSLHDLNRATLARQGLLERHRGTVPAVVGRLAGLQAQHSDPPYIALWSRRAGQTIAALEDSLRDRSVVKATLMRSTLHLVAAADYPAFDVATAEPRLANWRATARRAGVDLQRLHGELMAFCEQPRAVAEIGAWVERAAPSLSGMAPGGVRNTGYRAVAAGGGLVHVPPSGLWHEHGKPAYVTARSWLGPYDSPSFEDAMTTVVERYLLAYGPACAADIGKWLGQPRAPKIKAAIDALGDHIVRSTAEDGRELVDLAVPPSAPSLPSDASAPARFLSRWDSVLIGYDARERLLPAEHRSAVFKPNADILTTFLVDGFVAGLWTLETDADAARIRLTALGDIAKAARSAVAEEAAALVRYIAPEAARYEVAWTDRHLEPASAAAGIRPGRSSNRASPCSNGRA